jgi:hypothetical protein
MAILLARLRRELFSSPANSLISLALISLIGSAGFALGPA